MPRFVRSAVPLLLIPCLIGDALTPVAAAFGMQEASIHPWSANFEGQALMPAETWFHALLSRGHSLFQAIRGARFNTGSHPVGSAARAAILLAPIGIGWAKAGIRGAVIYGLFQLGLLGVAGVVLGGPPAFQWPPGPWPDWRPILANAVAQMDERLDIEFSDNLAGVFQQVENDIRRRAVEFGPAQTQSRRAQVVLVAQLFGAIMSGDESIVQRLDSSGVAPFTTVDVRFESFAGPIKAELSFRQIDRKPLLRIRLTLPSGQVLDEWRFGCDAAVADDASDIVHPWPHLDVAPSGWRTLSWAGPVDLYPSMERDALNILVQQDLMLQTLQRFEKYSLQLPHYRPPVPAKEEAIPTIVPATEVKAEGAAPREPAAPAASSLPAAVSDAAAPPRRSMTVPKAELPDFKKRVARAAGIKPERFSVSNEGLQRLAQAGAEEANASGENPQLAKDVRGILPNIQLNDLQVEGIIRELPTIVMTVLTRPAPPKPRPPMLRVVYTPFRTRSQVSRWEHVFGAATQDVRKPVLYLGNSGPTAEAVWDLAKRRGVTVLDILTDSEHAAPLRTLFIGSTDVNERMAAIANRTPPEAFLSIRRSPEGDNEFLQAMAHIFHIALEHGCKIVFGHPDFETWRMIRRADEEASEARVRFFLNNDVQGFIDRLRESSGRRRAALGRSVKNHRQEIEGLMNDGHDVIGLLGPADRPTLSDLVRTGRVVDERGALDFEDHPYHLQLSMPHRGVSESDSDYELRLLRSAVSYLLEQRLDLWSSQDKNRRVGRLVQAWERADLLALPGLLAEYTGAEMDARLFLIQLQFFLRDGLPGDFARRAEWAERLVGRVSQEGLARFAHYLTVGKWPEDPSARAEHFLIWMALEQESLGEHWILPEEEAELGLATGSMFWWKDLTRSGLSDNAYSRGTAWWSETVPAGIGGAGLFSLRSLIGLGRLAWTVPGVNTAVGIAFAIEHALDFAVNSSRPASKRRDPKILARHLAVAVGISAFNIAFGYAVALARWPAAAQALALAVSWILSHGVVNNRRVLQDLRRTA